MSTSWPLATAVEHGACVDCSTAKRVVFHYTGVCPFRRRLNAVPCRGASLAESRDGRHFTRNESAICDACRVKNAVVVAQLKAQRS